MKQKNPELFVCPECGSDRLIVSEITSFMLNTGEFYCHSVKSHDSDARVACLDCHAESTREQWNMNEPSC